MRARAPTLGGWIKVAIEAAATVKGRVISAPWRIKSPAEGTIENSVAWKKCVSIKPRIPIPAVSIPARSSIRISASGIRIRFGKIRGSQTRPAIQVLGFQFFLVEFHRSIRFARREIDHVAAFDFDPLPGPLQQRFAIQDPHRAETRVKVVESGFHQFRRFPAHQNLQVIFRMNFRNFYKRFSPVNRDTSVDKARRDHRGGTLFTQPDENSRRQQHFHLAVCGRENLAGIHFHFSHRRSVQCLPAQICLPFHVI